jgi:hypothetical protein
MSTSRTTASMYLTSRQVLFEMMFARGGILSPKTDLCFHRLGPAFMHESSDWTMAFGHRDSIVFEKKSSWKSIDLHMNRFTFKSSISPESISLVLLLSLFGAPPSKA